MDPSKMKVVDLRSELGALGLDTKGNKPALVERLKKALEARTGKVIPDTSILDTSTEDADEPATPRRPVPAPRTTRRSSSSRILATPAKAPPPREEPPEPIPEDPRPSEPYSPSQEDSGSDTAPLAEPAKVVVEPEVQPEMKEPEPELVPEPVPEPEPVPAPKEEEKQAIEAVEEPEPAKPEPMEVQESPSIENTKEEDVNTDEKEDEVLKEEKKDVADVDATPEVPTDSKMEDGTEEKVEKDEDEKMEEDVKRSYDDEEEQREEEEWDGLNERLRIREQERLERERKQAEEDAKRLEEVSNDPIKLNRYKRKQEKKARWSNFYRAVEVTNEVLSLPEDAQANKDRKEFADIRIPEPEIDDSKITLSWYDSDLNQYLEVPELNSVVPLSEGAFVHAWAGARASHGVDAGTVCYELRVGSVVSSSDGSEKESVSSGLRIGWSTEDSSLHLGESEFSWGYESTGRAVSNSEFKEYGKPLTEKDVVGAYLDLESNPCKISYTLNGEELGTAYEFDKSVLNGRPLYPHVLTKNTCYKVNFGYDKYTMLTKTTTIRRRIEVPVEEVLEEKRKIEAALQKQREEAAQRERVRRENEKQEREERQKKKKEEREKLEREEKEKEDQEKKDKGEEEAETEDGEKTEVKEDGEKEKEKEEVKEEVKDEDVEKEEEPKENGDKNEEQPASQPETVPEQMETEQTEENDDEKDTKEEPLNEGEIAEVTEEQVLKGHVLDKRIKFVIRYTVEEELDGPELALPEGFVFMRYAALVAGPARPSTLADCEVILMVGMPGSGKTYWAKQHAAANPDKRYNIISTGALFDRMKVDCKPFRASYDGRWDAMVSKCAKCVLKLLEIAKGRKRNFILDQTNVYPSAQRRKLREFDGYRRVAVVIVTDDETYRDRQKRREELDGKEVPDGAVVDMKANFALPERCAWLDDVRYPELGEAGARAAVDALHRQAREALRRARSAEPPPKRHRSGDRPRHARDERRPRDREDRWGGGGGGGGGGRWGGAGARGSRWGPRDARPAPPPSRFDRPWPQPPSSRGDFGRGGSRGGRGARGGPPDRFGRERPHRPNDRMDKRPHPPGGGNNGAGSWQRGGQAGGRGALQPRPAQPPPRPGHNNMKDGQHPNQNQQQNQQGWNQWAGGWGGWGNWNQNQGWNNWGNWGNWGNPQQGGGAGAAGQPPAGKQPQQQQQQQQQGQQWPANYTAQQWYQWQQWQQQQQQAWPGYQQGNQAGNTPDAQAWAQYYQNYGSGNANNASNAVTGGDKK